MSARTPLVSPRDTTVVVTFRALPGRGPELIAWLRTFHPRLRAFAGFERIAVHHDQQDPDHVIELEQWRAADDHRAMVEAVAREGGWDTMAALLTSEPETRYLRADGGLTASPAVFTLPFHGGCACGAIRYTCDAAPLTVALCFCRDCQRASGGACSTGVVVPAESLRITGSPRRHITRSDLGSDAWRAFCGDCGSPLFAGNSRVPTFTVIKVASLDDPSPAEPRTQVWTMSAPPWAHIEPQLPNHAKNPSRR
ncbi:MAG: GFA family protein [Polyangiales bacterium]